MSTVVDVGCASQGAERSIEKLVKRFQPDLFYGFDPALVLPTFTGHGVPPHWPIGCRLHLEAKAAWTRDGRIEFAAAGLDGTVMRAKNGYGEWGGEVHEVECFDLARFVRDLPDGEVILKLDAEGAEFPLLEHLHAQGADGRLTLVLVEWHDRWMGGDYRARRAAIVAALTCPLEEWS
jgi:FkbM family methyltransferase